MSSQARILKQAGGERVDYFNYKTQKMAFFRMKSGEQILSEMQKVLKSQKIPYTVEDLPECWLVKWQSPGRKVGMRREG